MIAFMQSCISEDVPRGLYLLRGLPSSAAKENVDDLFARACPAFCPVAKQQAVHSARSPNQTKMSVCGPLKSFSGLANLWKFTARTCSRRTNSTQASSFWSQADLSSRLGGFSSLGERLVGLSLHNLRAWCPFSYQSEGHSRYKTFVQDMMEKMRMLPSHDGGGAA